MTPKRRSSRPARRASTAPFRVLVVDDNELFAQAIDRELRARGVDVELAYDAAGALAASMRSDYQAILLDYKLPDDDGIRIIPTLLGRQPQCALIVMTAFGGIRSAIRAIRLGAEDYIVKETSTGPIIDRLLELRERLRVRRAHRGWSEAHADRMIGESDALARVREQIEKVATTADTTVLLTGETGVGKELAARYLHRVSARPQSPFVSVDCVAMPATLVESQLFGHEKGAFTDAHESRRGLFQEAGNGTILLDEIGDMESALQGKLLRVLETRRFRRVGSVQEHAVSARLVLATNRNLLQMVEQGRFRLDLYERLAVFPIHIPPLRERRADILPLAEHFIEHFGDKLKSEVDALSREARDRLLAYDFPGNVRELKNVLERAIILTDSGVIELRHLPERVLAGPADPDPTQPGSSSHAVEFVPGVDTLQSLEQKLIRDTLRRVGGVKAEAARLLGLSRYQLIRRIQKYQVEPGTEGEE